MARHLFTTAPSSWTESLVAAPVLEGSLGTSCSCLGALLSWFTYLHLWPGRLASGLLITVFDVCDLSLIYFSFGFISFFGLSIAAMSSFLGDGMASTPLVTILWSLSKCSRGLVTVVGSLTVVSHSSTHVFLVEAWSWLCFRLTWRWVRQFCPLSSLFGDGCSIPIACSLVSGLIGAHMYPRLLLQHWSCCHQRLRPR